MGGVRADMRAGPQLASGTTAGLTLGISDHGGDVHAPHGLDLKEVIN